MTDPSSNTLTAEGFRNSTHVSRETLERLESYAALLRKWQPKINLVGPKTLPDLWARHFLDSAQLLPLIPDGAKTHMDLGSGAGFPGLVIAILTELETHLVESDGRKAAFLREAARVTGVSDRVTIHAKRAESLDLPPVDLVTARALAPLPDLLSLSEPFWKPETLGLFLKGKRYEEELTGSKYGWYINFDAVPSQVDAESVILSISDLRRKGEEGEG